MGWASTNVSVFAGDWRRCVLAVAVALAIGGCRAEAPAGPAVGTLAAQVQPSATPQPPVPTASPFPTVPPPMPSPTPTETAGPEPGAAQPPLALAPTETRTPTPAPAASSPTPTSAPIAPASAAERAGATGELAAPPVTGPPPEDTSLGIVLEPTAPRDRARTIALDPGHGGPESGAAAPGLSEKDLNLRIALKLADLLRADGDSVVLTRDSDRAVSPLFVNGGAWMG